MEDTIGLLAAAVEAPVFLCGGATLFKREWPNGLYLCMVRWLDRFCRIYFDIILYDDIFAVVMLGFE